MSSLLQFSGSISDKGVGLQFVRVKPNERWPDSETLGEPVELVPCSRCGRSHARIHVAYRKPVGMLGCWVRFRYNGQTHAPDLSVPISVFRLPRDAKPVSDSENAEIWHS